MLEPRVARAALLHCLHAGPRMLVLPNAWDAASAQTFAAAGFPVIATTSGGVAATLGYRDHEDAPAQVMFAVAARIVRAVAIPVAVDFQAGYRLPPAEVAERANAVGVVVNLEDSDRHGGGILVEAERQAERLTAFKADTQVAGVDLVLNTRVDVFIWRVGTPEEQLAEGMQRGRLYCAAGADCLYPIGLAHEAIIAALGVRRVRDATSLFRESLEMVEQMASGLRATVSNELGPP